MSMFRFSRILCLGLICIVWACVQKPAITTSPEPSSQADALFQRAEEKYAAEAYEDALVLYGDYIERYSGQPMAAAALMKIGLIQMRQKDFPRAGRTFERVITDYPTGAFAEDAGVEILSVLYQQGRYSELIDEASTVLQSVSSPEHTFRIYVLVGDAYMAMQSPVEAVEFYAQARHFAAEEDQTAVDEKLRNAVMHLSPEDANALLSRTDPLLPLDLVLFQLGVRAAQQGDFSRALSLFEQFNLRFPDHEKRAEVAQMIEAIKQNASFDRRAIGCLLPLSGAYQAFGNRAMRGIEIALDSLRARPGLEPLNVIVKDTGSEPDRTVQALQELHAANVAAIVGPLVHVELAAREAQALGIPIITITQKDQIPEIGDNVFRNFLTPQTQVHALVSYAVEELGAMRFAILYPDEVYGRTFMDLFWSELEQYGGRVVGVEAYDPTQTDFSDPIRKLVGLYYPVAPDLIASRPKGLHTESHRKRGRSGRDAQGAETEEELEAIVDFDALFLPESPKAAGLIIPQLAFHDVRHVTLLGTNLWHSQSLLELAEQYVQGAILPDGFFAQSPAPEVRSFVERFEETFQETPGYIEAILYDSAMILFDVITRPEIRFRGDIRRALVDENGFAGVTGHTRFDENGEAIKQAFLLRIKGNEFEEIDRR